jgi:hypothetical protein
LQVRHNYCYFITMIDSIKKTILVIGLVSFSLASFAQCEILNRLSPDGSMNYYMEPVNFYWTQSKSLKGCIVTDKESYFLLLLPVPFPEKPQGNKLKGDLDMKLSDGNSYQLKHFDTRYAENDTIMEMLYLIDEQDIDRMLNLEVTQVSIDMMGEEGIRTYVFKLHKAALKEQLACFLNEEKQEKKK